MGFNGNNIYIYDKYIEIYGNYGDLWEIYDVWKIPSGKRLQFPNWNMVIEIVDLPMKNSDFP